MWTRNAEGFDRIPSIGGHCYFEWTAKQPTKPCRFACLSNNALQYLVRWISQHVFKQAAPHEAKEICIVHTGYSKDNVS